MGKRIASPKATAGLGFEFENSVVAYFLLLLLLQKEPLKRGYGYVTRLDFQTESLGWEIDDLLVTLRCPGAVRRWAVSIKSNTQFTSKSAPNEFVEKAWKQVLKREEPNPAFDLDADFLGMATAPHGERVWNAVEGLFAKARAQHEADLAGRLIQPGYAQYAANILASLACPEHLAEQCAIDVSPSRLATVVQIQQFDFHFESSRNRILSLELCRLALRSESPEDADSLWDDLVRLAGDARPRSGFYDLPKLVSELRDRHDLKDSPRYATEWSSIRQWTLSRLNQIPEHIGRTIRIPRETERRRIADAVAESNATVILGQTGIGKTTLLKQCAEECWTDGLIIWLEASLFASHDIDEIQMRIGVECPLDELLASTPNRQSIVVVDAVDRLLDRTAFARLTAFMKAARSHEKLSWRFVATCQPEEWDRVRSAITRADGPISDWRELPVSRPSPSELEPVWKQFPALHMLAAKAHLAAIVTLPRILDLLVSRLSQGDVLNADDWVGESSLISWYWESEVRARDDGTERSAFLQQFAVQLADEGLTDTSLLNLPPGKTGLLRGLVDDRILIEREERVSFYHDSIGDWARQTMLRSIDRDLDTFLADRRTRPHWHRAIRLYAVHLLECNRDASEWNRLINRMPSIADFALDGIVFAADPESLLDHTWKTLIENNGALLKRLLRRLTHVATLPNEHLLRQMAASSERNPFFRTFDRTPCAYWPIWTSVLASFQKHSDDLVHLAPVETAQIARTWLTMTPTDWPVRSVAAHLAVSIAEVVEESRCERRYDDNDEGTTCYQAALTAAHELPDRLTRLLRIACARVSIDSDSASLERDAGQWPDGPLART